ncbi:hypothetical protein ACFY1U_36625 [Streptomyces sp. NPDC001351]
MGDDNDMQAKFQKLPNTIREKVESTLADAEIALELRNAGQLADKA